MREAIAVGPMNLSAASALATKSWRRNKARQQVVRALDRLECVLFLPRVANASAVLLPRATLTALRSLL